MEISIGEIILDEEIKLGNIELDVVKEYPYLENLEITPTAGQQIFTHPDSYGYNEVKVDAINLQDKSVTPTQAQQIIFADIGYSGLNNVKIEAATSDIDSNIQSYNIKKDVSILGVTGNVIELNGEERATTPTKDTQIITPSADKNAITKMTVNPIPDEYIIPSGEIEITANGNYNVTDKASAKVEVPEKQLGAKTITKNGVYNATDDNLDGYSQVTVETSGVDINDYFKPTIAAATNLERTNGINDIIKKIPDTITISGDSCAGMFQYCAAITTIPLLDTSKVTDMRKMFYNCNSLQTIPVIDTSKVITMTSMFSGCTSLQTIPLFNASEVTSMTSMFENCTSLQTIPAMDTSKVRTFERTFFACSALQSLPLLDMSSVTSLYGTFVRATNLMHSSGFPNLGKAYLTTSAANNYTYTLTLSSCSKLTEASIINILNNLYDIKTKGCKPQKVVLGNANLAKLTSEEGQTALSNAQAKGWTIS